MNHSSLSRFSALTPVARRQSLGCISILVCACALTAQPAIPASATTATQVAAAAAQVAQRHGANRFCYFPQEVPEQPGIEISVQDELRDDIAEYVGHYNGRLSADEAEAVADELCGAGLMFAIDPWLLACLARFESTFYRDAVGRSAGERGLLQIHPMHNCGELTPTQYGALMIRTRLDNGKTLYQAIKPWTVRPTAWAEYQRLFEGGCLD